MRFTRMKRMQCIFLLGVLTATLTAGQNANTNPANATDRAHQSNDSPALRVMDLETADGTLLKATYFAAAKPGPAQSLRSSGVVRIDSPPSFIY